MEPDSLSYLTQITNLQSHFGGQRPCGVLQNTTAPQFQQWQTILCAREKV